MPRNAVDHTGKKFDRLYVLRRDTSKKNRSYWICQCQCGVTLSARASHLISGVVPSCGCRRRELISQLSTKHGHYAGNKASITYKSWSSMHDRCGKYKGYKTVSICKEWSDFTIFLADMGERPSLKYSIDRICTSGNYEPGNCRWATTTEQNRNKSNNHRITHAGKTLTVTEWAERLSIPNGILYRRLKLGWDAKRAIETPVAKRSHSGWRQK
jgi:hypothetical protein